MSDLLSVNGNLISWGSGTLKLDSQRYQGFTGITFGDKRERVKGYGQARHQGPLGRSLGKYTTDPVKVTFWKHSAEIFRLALAAKSKQPASYGGVEFQIDLQYAESDIAVPIHIVINRCVWSSEADSMEESADPLKVEIEFDCMSIVRNGLVIYDTSNGPIL
jgi:hypothetical protein